MAGATYTQISIREMESYLKRAFRALKPTKTVLRGETVFELAFNETETIGVQIYTSIGHGQEYAAEQGADAIRVGFFNFKLNRPMITGKFPIVKRTQGWRDSLKDRIEDYMELYEEKEAYWESRAQGSSYQRPPVREENEEFTYRDPS